MGARTRIDWADASWNPVTGCLHGCKYCYARRIANRFGNHLGEFEELENGTSEKLDFHVLNKPFEFRNGGWVNGVHVDLGTDGKSCPYPFDFEPTFHRYRLDEPQKWKRPRNIFVCSMADLCGQWVSDEWKQDVIAACKAAPQHRYLFLTKNPYGYNIWPTKDRSVEHEFNQENFWLGCSMTGTEDLNRYDNHYGRYLYAMNGNMIPGMAHRFVSIEPILTDVMELPGYLTERFSALKEAILSRYAGHIEWVIVGAETGNRKGKVIPERRWIEKIMDACRQAGKPVFMKESLREIMGDNFVQEFPWKIK